MGLHFSAPTLILLPQFPEYCVYRRVFMAIFFLSATHFVSMQSWKLSIEAHHSKTLFLATTALRVICHGVLDFCSSFCLLQSVP